MIMLKNKVFFLILSFLLILTIYIYLMDSIILFGDESISFARDTYGAYYTVFSYYAYSILHGYGFAEWFPGGAANTQTINPTVGGVPAKLQQLTCCKSRRPF